MGFTRHTTVSKPRVAATIRATADNVLQMYVNGKFLKSHRNWTTYTTAGTRLKAGDVVAFVITNLGRYSSGNPAGLKAEIRMGRRLFGSRQNHLWRCTSYASSKVRYSSAQVRRVPVARKHP